MSRTRTNTQPHTEPVSGTGSPMGRRTLLRAAGTAGVLAVSGGLLAQTPAVAADTSLKAVQTGLQGLDYYQGEVDGQTGPKTKDATKRFQKDRLLSVDGAPGPKTTTELETVIGSVQKALDVEETGTFDEATKKAVTTFQKSDKDLEPTGRAGEATMKALDVERVKEPTGGEPNSKISRTDVIERAMFWVDDPRPYSMHGTSEGIDGKKWRRDCSGFVSMAWNLRNGDGDTGTGTGQLPEVLDTIDKDDLKPGDALLITPGQNGASYGHVVLFNGWKDEKHSTYEGLEQVGGNIRKTTKRTISYPYDNGKTFLPYRYPKITD